MVERGTPGYKASGLSKTLWRFLTVSRLLHWGQFGLVFTLFATFAFENSAGDSLVYVLDF